MAQHPDTIRLNRILKGNPEIVVEVNEYGAGALGNSLVHIDTRHDIDAVLKMEAEAIKKGLRK